MQVTMILLLAGLLAGPDFDVLPLLEKRDGAHPNAGRGMLNAYLIGDVNEALDRRFKRYEDLQTADEIAEYQREMKQFFVEQLGGFPERTPLKARLAGRIEGQGYRIEKVIYESQPGFPVTALLYLPASDPPYPAVLHPCGHSANGKAAEAYQQASILMARKGLAVLCFDPVGQGERKQLIDRKNLGGTSEHMHGGVAPILLGQNLARAMIWDGMRGIDYLISRDEIDGQRIGCTGNSGGGMMTSYLMALDERIVCAAPSCFITTTRRKNVLPGPGDAEQNIHAQTAYGMDHPDFLLMRAPRPTLICSATRDYVPIEGAWEAFRQAKRLYAQLGYPERVDLVEADAPHGFSEHLRIGVTRWMRRWLLDNGEPIDEEPVDLHSDEALQCTPGGQVLRLEGVRSLFDLYREKEAELADRRRSLWETESDAERLEAVRQRAGIRPLAELAEPTVERLGEKDYGTYRVEKLVLKPEPEIVLPALLFRSRNPSGPYTLYVDGEGKHAGAEPGGIIEQRVERGETVLAVDLRGYGETATEPWRYRGMADTLGPNAAEYFIAYMLGRSLLGMRSEDLLSSALYLLDESEQGDGQLQLVASGHAGVPALHAAALEPDLFSRVELHQTLDSWQDVIRSGITGDGQLENTVHGALEHYDLPDLRRVIGEDRLRVVDPRDALGQPLDERRGD